MKEIIITGASGFVGKNLSLFLTDAGYKVTPLSLRDSNWKSKISKSAFAVIHLAGLAHDLKNTNNDDDYYRVNTELTKELYDHVLTTEIQKFMFFSSVKAVADSVGDDILYEDHQAAPQTVYGKSKRLAEEYILDNLPENKKVYILRPCMIHGPHNKGNLNLLYSVVKKGVPYPLAAFDNQRSFLAIDNLNFLVGKLCEKDVSSDTFNLSDSGYLSTVQVVQIINDVLKKRAKLWKVNKKSLKFAAAVGTKLKLPLTTERLNKLTESYQVSNQKILDALGVTLPVNIDKGIMKTIDSFTK